MSILIFVTFFLCTMVPGAFSALPTDLQQVEHAYVISSSESGINPGFQTPEIKTRTTDFDGESRTSLNPQDKVTDFDQEGRLFGRVTDALTGDPIEDAVILTQHGFRSVTDENGDWAIDDAIAEVLFSTTARKDGYADLTFEDLFLEEDDELEINFDLIPLPEFEIAPDQVNRELFPGESTEVDLTISNTGNGPLEWSCEKRTNPLEFRMTEMVGATLEDDRIMGVAYANDHFYISGANKFGREDDENLIYKLDREGALIASFEQFGESLYGITDLAYDGERLIYGPDGDIVYGFTPEGELATEFEGPYNPTTVIAWDSDRELLWMSGRSAPRIFAYNIGGERVDTVSCPEFSLYGLAYWPEDPDGYNLYLFHKVGADQQTVHKMNTETNDTMFVGILEPELGGDPQGAFITNQYDPDNWVFMNITGQGMNNGGDRLDIWQLYAQTEWFNLDMDEGQVAPDGEQALTLTLDATDLDLRTWEGTLLFTHNALIGETKVPVILDVVLSAPTEQRDLPEEFALTSVYPNPFNSSTTISYTLPHPSHLTIHVFDLSGRQVETLVDDNLPAGHHSVVWDGSKSTSGVYLIKMQTPAGSFVRKAVVIR